MVGLGLMLAALAPAATAPGQDPTAPLAPGTAGETRRGNNADGARDRAVAAARWTGGAVASGHALATAAGLDVLRDGGNAADAAVATALALAVVYPEAGNLAGGGFAVVRMAAPAGQVTANAFTIRALDFRETAPAAARRTMFLGPDGQPRPGASKVGPLAAGVPGSPTGLYELHHTFGRLPWARVVAPAIALARDGFIVDEHLHQLLGAEAIRRPLESFPATTRVWLPGGQPLAAGTRLRRPELAATLEDYAARGPAALTTGRVAAAVAAASQANGGVLTAADLAAYRPVWRPALTFDAFGWHFATMPLPSAGGIVLGQTLAMLERLGWAALPRGGADRPHLLAEVFRRAFADRELLGDPASTLAAPADLLDPRWLAARAAGIDRHHATPSAALAPWPAPAAQAPGAASRGERGETTHLSTIDGDGNAVALTTTLNGLFGCGLYVPEVGFLNNEMDDFATGPPGNPAARAALAALAASTAAEPRAGPGGPNAVSPGRRMLSSMTPAIVWREGRGGCAGCAESHPESPENSEVTEIIALGGRGSLRIPTSTAQVVLDLLVDHDTLAAAVSRPRLHHQRFPDLLEAEPGALSPEVVQELTRRGQRIAAPRPLEVARVNAVRRTAGGSFMAAVDPRGSSALGGAGVLAPRRQP
jgi:gamma-glutamyltranspeptidase/glutathione hydrolase